MKDLKEQKAELKNTKVILGNMEMKKNLIKENQKRAKQNHHRKLNQKKEEGNNSFQFLKN